MLVAAGSLMEREDERGLAHMFEHMAFKGSQNMPAGDLVQYLERLGMAFGADTNASTGFDSTVYKLELPSNKPDLLDRGLLVLREKGQALIPAAELDKERGVVLSEKRMRDTARYRAYVAGLDFLLPDARAPKRWPIGLEEVISTAPRERLLDFYRRYYTPSRITLIAVGAIEPASFAVLIHRHFDSFRAQGTEEADPDPGSVNPRGLEARLHYEAEGRTTVSLSVARPYQAGPDTRARRARSICTGQRGDLAPAVHARAEADAGFLGGTAQATTSCSPRSASCCWTPSPIIGARRSASPRPSCDGRSLRLHPAELDEQKKSLLSEFKEASRGAATASRRSGRQPGARPDGGPGIHRSRPGPAEISEILALVSPETAVQAARCGRTAGRWYSSPGR
jgi:hypothetical protein